MPGGPLSNGSGTSTIQGMPAAPRSSTRLIVNQRTLDWSVAWKRALRGSGITICQTRTLTQCGEALAASPASFLALEVAEINFSAVIDAVLSWSQKHPAARFMAMLDRGSAAYEPIVREAGAIHVVHSPLQLESAVRLVKRYLAVAPKPEMTLRDAIWNRLPWAG